MSRIGKIIESRRKESGVVFSQPKLFVPVDMQVPETAKQVLARTLLECGVISEESANKMLGVITGYDSDSENEFEDDDFDDFDDLNDEFILSSFASYEEDLEELNGKEDQKQTTESVSEGGPDSANDVSSEAVGEQGGSETTEAE